VRLLLPVGTRGSSCQDGRGGCSVVPTPEGIGAIVCCDQAERQEDAKNTLETLKTRMIEVIKADTRGMGER